MKIYRAERLGVTTKTITITVNNIFKRRSPSCRRKLPIKFPVPLFMTLSKEIQPPKNAENINGQFTIGLIQGRNQYEAILGTCLSDFYGEFFK